MKNRNCFLLGTGDEEMDCWSKWTLHIDGLVSGKCFLASGASTFASPLEGAEEGHSGTPFLPEWSGQPSQLGSVCSVLKVRVQNLLVKRVLDQQTSEWNDEQLTGSS